MGALYFVENIMGVKLNSYQKELLMLIDNNPRGYLGEVLGKHPNHNVKQVADLYHKYEQRHLVSL